MHLSAQAIVFNLQTDAYQTRSTTDLIIIAPQSPPDTPVEDSAHQPHQ
jgi:hypothetical protein